MRFMMLLLEIESCIIPGLRAIQQTAFVKATSFSQPVAQGTSFSRHPLFVSCKSTFYICPRHPFFPSLFPASPAQGNLKS